MYAVLTDFCIYLKLLNKIINRYDVVRIFSPGLVKSLTQVMKTGYPGAGLPG